MNSVIAQSAAEPLIFSWDSPRGEKLAIAVFLAISLVAHAVCFYIFQLVYPPTVAVHFARQKTALPITVAKTSVSFSNELEVFGVPILPEPAFVASNEEMPETIRFRVGVSKLGEIRYCFPVNSSGDSALDEQARLYVAHCRFSQNTANAGKADSFLAWGTATIVWGNDIARPQPARGASVTQ